MRMRDFGVGGALTGDDEASFCHAPAKKRKPRERKEGKPTYYHKHMEGWNREDDPEKTSQMEGEAEEDGEALEQLRHVFNLCDGDKDGVISVEEFRQIGRHHFDRTKPMEVLIQKIDPDGTGHITFPMFQSGIETFLISRIGRSRSTSRESGSVDIDAPSSPNTSPIELSSLSEDAFGSESAVHPLFPSSHSLIPNGYLTESSPPDCDLLYTMSTDDGENESGTPLHSSPMTLRRQSLPLPREHTVGVVGRLKWTRHSQLALPVSPAGSGHSKCSTPAELEEADGMVSHLSDQLQDLSVRLEGYEEDQRSNHGARERLRKEKEALEEKVEEYEEKIQSTKDLSQKMLQETTERHNVTLNKLRRQSQAQLDDITSQLETYKVEVENHHSTEANLKTQLSTANDRLEEYEGRVCVLEERGREKEEEVRRVRELLRTEKTERDKEKDRHSQVVVEYESQVRHWQKTCEEVRKEKKRRSLTVSDMDSEVNRLSKEIERLKRENEQLQSLFLRQGKELLSHKTQSLADEMEDASKDEVMKALRETEEHNTRLHQYIEGLLVSIIEKHPELLEKR